MHFTLQKVIRLNLSLSKAWAFFSDPRNLSEITPPALGFSIQGNPGQKIYPGQIITYQVRPVLNIPLTWVTEITQVQEPIYFVDEQRYGPYRMWHHQHILREVPGGVEVEDIVDYILPLGLIGLLVHPFIVRPKIEAIFTFRSKVLLERFGGIAN